MLATIHNDLEPQKTKGRSSVILLLIIILMAAVGGGVYYWQKMEAKKLATTAADKVRDEMQNKIDDLQKNINEAENKISEKQNNIDNLLLQRSPNIFSTSTAKVGDQIVGMTIKSIGPQNGSEINWLNDYKIEFTGQVDLSGDYIFSDLLNAYCFKVDSTDQIKLPKIDNEINTGFCFSNDTDQTKNKLFFKQVNGKANITIDEYTIGRYALGADNSAKLIKINP